VTRPRRPVRRSFEARADRSGRQGGSAIRGFDGQWLRPRARRCLSAPSSMARPSSQGMTCKGREEPESAAARRCRDWRFAAASRAWSGTFRPGRRGSGAGAVPAPGLARGDRWLEAVLQWVTGRRGFAVAPPRPCPRGSAAGALGARRGSRSERRWQAPVGSFLAGGSWPGGLLTVVRSGAMFLSETNFAHGGIS
jgi:hypothetical protein